MQHKYSDEPGGGGGFLMGLVCGAAVGAAAGLLFAPRPGAGMRAQVGDTASRVGKRARDTYERASNVVSDVKSRAEDMSHRFKKQAGDVAERAEEHASNAVNAINREP
ncbi:MAG: YtxH domain-containing protein [Vicinamibacterales bacterium]